MDDLLNDLRARMQTRQIPGLGIRLARNQDILFQCDLGVSDLSSGKRLTQGHVFRMGSLTKPILAHAIIRLANQGYLDLDDAITQHLPYLANQPEMGKVTIFHLLCHTAGLLRGNYGEHYCCSKSIQSSIASAPLLFEPGQVFKYSNWGYYLLGELIASVRDEFADEYISREIFTPLGMQKSEFYSNGEDVKKNKLADEIATGYWKGWYFGCPDLMAPSIACRHIPLPTFAAGLVATADDYLRWLMSFAGAEHPPDSIDARIIGQMLQVKHRVNERSSVCPGLFVEMIDGLLFYYAAGSCSGFSGFMFLIPALDLVGVAFCNHDTCTKELREILYQACRRFIDNDVLPMFGRHARTLNILAGSRKHLVHIKSEQGNIPGCVLDECEIRLYPHTENVYLLLDGDERRHMLRLGGVGKGNAVLSMGDQVFYENLKRLRKQQACPQPWQILVGYYRHAVFGMVEIICRGDQVFLNYGVAYEVLLKPIGGLCFKQAPGAFCFEIITFEKDPVSGQVVSFLLNEMQFLRQGPK